MNIFMIILKIIINITFFINPKKPLVGSKVVDRIRGILRIWVSGETYTEDHYESAKRRHNRGLHLQPGTRKPGPGPDLDPGSGRQILS